MSNRRAGHGSLRPSTTRLRIAALLLLAVAGMPAGAGPEPVPLVIDNDLAPSALGYWSTTLEAGATVFQASATVFRFAFGDVFQAENVLAIHIPLIDVGNDGDAVALNENQGQGLSGATFAGWAVDVVPDIIAELFTGDGFPVSLDGDIDTSDLPPFSHPFFGPVFGTGDVTADLAWDLDPGAENATIVVSLGGSPQATEGAVAIPTLSGTGIATFAGALLAIALGTLAARRRREGVG